MPTRIDKTSRGSRASGNPRYRDVRPGLGLHLPSGSVPIDPRGMGIRSRMGPVMSARERAAAASPTSTSTSTLTSTSPSRPASAGGAAAVAAAPRGDADLLELENRSLRARLAEVERLAAEKGQALDEDRSIREAEFAARIAHDTERIERLEREVAQVRERHRTDLRATVEQTAESARTITELMQRCQELQARAEGAEDRVETGLCGARSFLSPDFSFCVVDGSDNHAVLNFLFILK
jgi:hypothetical protein